MLAPPSDYLMVLACRSAGSNPYCEWIDICSISVDQFLPPTSKLDGNAIPFIALDKSIELFECALPNMSKQLRRFSKKIQPHYRPDRLVQVEHYFLDLILDISSQRLQGHCHLRLNPLISGTRRLTINGVNLEIQAVTIKTIPQNFTYDGQQLEIELSSPLQQGERIKISIAYGVTQPQRGLYFVMPSPKNPQRSIQVWTQGEEEDARFWFPCFDHPSQLATSELRIRVPREFRAISNGQLLKQQVQGKSKIYHWQQTQVHPSYLMTLVVGQFVEIKNTWQGKSVNYYIAKHQQPQALRSLGKTPRMLDFLSQTFGYAYPFDAYHQICVADFVFGGMENTGATVLSDRYLLDKRASLDDWETESLVVHELAHQWFGNLVVINDWSQAWIKEGMACYAEVLWTGHEYDQNEAAYYRFCQMESYLAGDDSDSLAVREASAYAERLGQQPMVTNIYQEPIELYDRHIYEKGACVYHMIWAELGDDLFTQFIHGFLADNAHQNVETVDVLRAIDKFTGRNLSYLFDQYVYRGGHPHYRVVYEWNDNRKLAQITITQKQGKSGLHILDRNIFDLQVPIGFGYVIESKVTVIVRPVRIGAVSQVFYFPLEIRPSFVSFDVGNSYLKTVELRYGLPELLAQLEYDPDPLSRIYAARAIATKGNLSSVEALGHCLKTEPFWAVRLEAATALATIHSERASELLIAEIEDEDPFVRQAIIQGLSQFPTPTSYVAIRQLVRDGDESYRVEALACEVLGDFSGAVPAPSSEIRELLTKVLRKRSGWNELVRSGAIQGLAKLNDPLALELVLEYTIDIVAQPLRLSAIRAVGIMAKQQNATGVTKIVERLKILAADPFFLIQEAVIEALAEMAVPEAIDLLQTIAEKTLDGQIQRLTQTGIQRVQQNLGDERALYRLQNELEAARGINQALRERLTHLEP
jgi:aminopeptidase N